MQQTLFPESQRSPALQRAITQLEDTIDFCESKDLNVPAVILQHYRKMLLAGTWTVSGLMDYFSEV